MEFIDRENERNRLKQALHSPKPRFIVIYGRRRMGKSTLIKNILTSDDIYYEVEQNEPQIQLDMLSRTISQSYPAFSGARFESWESLFLAFNEICIVNSTLVLDEFPYLVSKQQSLPSTLQRLIDSGNLKYNIIICGSSQRMMQKMVLGPAEPLYGRADEKLLLGPIAPRFWQKAFNLSAKAAVEEFAVWGGVPRYWALRENYSSMCEAIEYLALDEHGVLANEPAALFLDEVSDLAPYSSIMTALAEGNNRFSAISSKTGLKTTELPTPLANLAEMFYISKEVPFGEDEAKTKKTLYVFNDPFIEFYYTFIAPNKSLLALGRIDPVKQLIANRFPLLVSRVWERMCRRAVSGNQFFGDYWNVASRWWGKMPVFEEGRKTPSSYMEAEFDLVSESLDKKRLLIGECKWTQPDYASRILHKLKEKAAHAPFVKGREVEFVLFLKNSPLDHPDCHVLLPDDVIAHA